MSKENCDAFCEKKKVTTFASGNILLCSWSPYSLLKTEALVLKLVENKFPVGGSW